MRRGETEDNVISPSCLNFVKCFYVEMSTTSYQTKTWTFTSIGNYW